MNENCSVRYRRYFFKMGVVSEKGEMLSTDKKGSRTTPAKRFSTVSRRGYKNSDCEGVAVSIPGYVDPESGYIAMGGAIRDFDRFAIGQWLRDKTSLPVSVENDANCALLAERWLGKAQEMSDFLMMTIGTGIGGAIFCNNALVRGRQRRAGEFGSLLTSRPGSDSVLNYTMNTTCTMRVLTRNYSLHTGRPQEEISGEEIFERYDNNDPVCDRLVTTFIRISAPVFIICRTYLIPNVCSSAAALPPEKPFSMKFIIISPGLMWI